MSPSRQLAAIMFTDVVGYTRLMGEDEHRALQLLRKNRKLHKAIIKKQNGKWLKEMGDGTLASFSTPSDAVFCAKELMNTCREEEIILRIGIHQGEITEEGGDIFGDGVNIASRLESLAPEGDIYISESVARDIENKKGLDTDFIRVQKLKHVKHAVSIYKVNIGEKVMPKQPNQLAELEKRKDKSNEMSIAVLPFENMSGDPEQSYFSDGITEDIITDLSKVSSILVIARNSSFTYKGRSVKTREVCADLGVRYVVEGSVRKSGNRVRITAQLIDGLTDGHIWADRYDGTLEDIFKLQDEVTCQIIDALKIHLLPEEKKAIKKVHTPSIQAYEFYLKGREHFHYYTKDNYQKAQDYFNRAIEYDESYAQPYCGLADCGSFLHTLYGGEYLLSDALTASTKAIALAPDMAEGHASFGLVLSNTGDYKGAVKEFKTSVRLDPNLYEAHYYWARTCFTQGKLEEAATHFEDAWERSPKDPQTPSLLLQVYRSLGRQADLDYAAKATVKAGFQKLEEEPDNWRTCLSLAFGLLNLKQFSESIKYLDLALKNNTDDALINYNVACLYSGMGEINKAMHHLEISLKLGNNTIGWIKNDSDLDQLRNLPQFLELIKKYL